MNKKPEERLTIKEVLEHEWIKKYFYNEVKRRKSFDIKNFINEQGDKYNPLKNKKYEKAPLRKQSSGNGAYRLYADISSEEGKN